MNHSVRIQLLRIAAVCGALGVMIGAFGAHGLPNYLADRIDDPAVIAKRIAQFDTSARYHLVHAVALLALAAIPSQNHKRQQWCGYLFVLGIILFSGSLYLLVATNTPRLGAITPLGGLSWIAAWLMCATLNPWKESPDSD